jgi:hypothetical protein
MFKSHRKTRKTIALSASALAAGLGLAVVPAVTASGASVPAPPFTQCPAIGASTGCAILLVVNPDESVSVLGDPSVGPYDGTDDTLVGIVNNSSSAVSAVTVSGPGSDLSVFDGDGICTFGSWSGASGCPYGPTGYEGPGTSFVTSASLPDSAEVDFSGGLAPGAHAYFSLEGALTSAELTAREGPLTCDAVLPPGGGTTPDYCIPNDWDAHTVASSPVQGVEPLNLIISANSTVPFATVLAAMPAWQQVETGTTLPACLSEETADVAGTGLVGQDQSWRLRGCIEGGIGLAGFGAENHIRIWNQPIHSSTVGGSWFVTASFEQICKIPGHSFWHCITEDGYNKGASHFAADIETAARANHWKVTDRFDSRAAGPGGIGANSGSGTGLNDISFGANVEVLTITK